MGTDQVLAWATVVLAIGTLGIWGATMWLVRGTKQAAERELRAYVGAVPVGFEPKPGIPEGTLPQQIILTVENCGQTPAYEVQAVTNWWHGIREPPPNFDFPDFEGAGTGPRSIGSLYSGKPMSFSFALDPTLYLNAQLGTAALFCYGHVDYRDVFGHQWSTRYCYVVQPNRGGVGGAFTQYQRHNDAT